MSAPTMRAQEALGADVIGHDASGNPILKDIGTYLRDNIKKHIKATAARGPYLCCPHRLLNTARNSCSGT